MKTKDYFIERAEKRLNNGFNFDSVNYDNIINELELENEQYEYISWEELKDKLISNGWKYCYWEDSIITNEYAKELGLIDDEEEDNNDDDNDEEIKELDKKRKNIKANNAIGETIANDLFIKDFEPTNEFIPYSTLTDHIRSYLDNNGIKKTEADIFQIRKWLTTHLCNLINTNTIYNASIELGEGETHLKVIKKK